VSVGRSPRAMTGGIAPPLRSSYPPRAGNFYWGIRLLPRPKFEALCAIYAFAREIDDIGDGTLDDATKLAELARARTAIEQLDGGTPGPVLTALAHVERSFPCRGNRSST